jgi:hypothetical protein
MFSHRSVFQDHLPVNQKCLLIRCHVVIVNLYITNFDEAAVGPKEYWGHSRCDSVRNEYNELERAELMRGAEEKDRVINKIDFLHVFEPKKLVPSPF